MNIYLKSFLWRLSLDSENGVVTPGYGCMDCLLDNSINLYAFNIHVVILYL